MGRHASTLSVGQASREVPKLLKLARVVAKAQLIGFQRAP